MNDDGFVRRAMIHAATKPDAVAVRDAHGSWTWTELLLQARSYAAQVRAAFPLADAVPAIPILVGRDRRVVAAILGTLLAGRAFAPLSIKHPAARVSACLEQLGAHVLIDALGGDEVCPEPLSGKLWRASAADPVDDTPAPTSPDDPLYILFTSGSTGVPKGVLCSHANIVNTMLWSADQIDWRSDDVIGCAVQFSFDISMFDLFTTLFFGVPLMIFPEPSDPSGVLRHVAHAGVTSIFAVPAFFAQFGDGDLLERAERGPLRRILSGGDFFPPSQMLRWIDAAPSIEVLNVWGPTETSIVNTMHPLTPHDVAALRAGDHAPVGRAHPHMPFVLIDQAGEPVDAPGERGEIWMLGACVTQGYLGDEEQTGRVYVEHRGAPAFRTGDIGFLDDRGLLHIAGRTGSVVKIAGYRIDLAEVESAATGLDTIRQAAAFVHKVTPEINEVWLAVEAAESVSGIDISAVKRGLRSILPNYMVPKRIFSLDPLPLNANQKIDRRAARTQVEEALGP